VLTPSTLADAVDGLLLSRSVGGCTVRTVQLYREVLRPFVAAVGYCFSIRYTALP